MYYFVMQSYPESANPLITTLFNIYVTLWLFILVVFEIFVVSIKIHMQL